MYLEFLLTSTIVKFDGRLLWKNHDFDYSKNDKSVYIRNRIVLLQTIESLFSKHYYHNPANNLYHYDPWTLFLISPKNTNIFPLVYSLINTGLTYGEGRRVIKPSLVYLVELTAFIGFVRYRLRLGYSPLIRTQRDFRIYHFRY